MKKLGKLIINPEKIIKNKELVKLKGGAYNCYCNGYFLGERDTQSGCDSLCAACTDCW